MNRPTPKKFRMVADRFEGVVEKYPSSVVKMASGGWSIHHPCDTPACVAGWHAVARNVPRGGFLKGKTWASEAHVMSRDLGFEGVEAFMEYIGRTPEVWTSPFNNPFLQAEAWGATDDTITLHHVIARLRAAADYMEAS